MSEVLGLNHLPWQINAIDLLLMQRYLTSQTTLNATQLDHADVDTDGVVDIADLLALEQILQFPEAPPAPE